MALQLINDLYFLKLLPSEKFIELDSIRETAFSYFTNVHDTAVSQLFGHEIIDKEALIVGWIGFYAAYEVGLAFVDLFNKLEKRVLKKFV